MSKRSITTFSLASVLAMAASLSAGAMNIALTTGDSDAALVGKTMTLTASSTDSGTIRYRFRVRRPGANYRMIRDYGPEASLDWTPDREGLFEIEVSAKDRESGDVATTTETISVEPRVTGNLAVVNPTSHPLVFLASAPACVADGRMRVKFQTANGPVQQTPFKRCTPGESMNFYLAGLYADTDYSARVELDDAQTISQGSVIPFRSGSLPEFDWQQTPLQAGSPNSAQQVLLATAAGSQIATDLNGNVIWFNPSPSPVTYGTAFEAGGYLWGFIEDDSNPVELQGIRKVDLLGQTVLETNAERVNQQLEAMGRHKISGFHHEVRTLPDGRIVALASTERILTDTQGPGDVDVLGDMIIVFDRNLQVLWTWDTFDHLDVTRRATQNEVCGPGAGGCPPFYLAPTANDWTHGNSVRQTPDGDLLYSARHQDWLIKIAYANGEGDGHIVWKLGKDGDFTFAGSDPYPWFSHQHDGNFESANRIVVFDNGNTRIAANGGEGNSRGQVIQLDEENRKASLVLNADLGLYSFAVGSAQRLLDGNYHFDAGYVPSPTGLTAFALEVDGSGKIVSTIKANTLIYRSMRITDMYTN